MNTTNEQLMSNRVITNILRLQMSGEKQAREQRTPKVYLIWRKQIHDRGCTRWIKTAHTVLAMNAIQAQEKVRRKFLGAGFHSMSLLASIEDPNNPIQPAEQTVRGVHPVQGVPNCEPAIAGNDAGDKDSSQVPTT